MASELLRPPVHILEECEREPIHTPGAIQPHGVLLVVEEPSLRLVQASVNASEKLGLFDEVLLGRSLESLFRGPEAEEWFRSFGSNSLATTDRRTAS